MKYLLARLQEPSTYNALGLILGGFGLHVPSPIWSTATTALAGVSALVGALLPESSQK